MISMTISFRRGHLLWLFTNIFYNNTYVVYLKYKLFMECCPKLKKWRNKQRAQGQTTGNGKWRRIAGGRHGGFRLPIGIIGLCVTWSPSKRGGRAIPFRLKSNVFWWILAARQFQSALVIIRDPIRTTYGLKDFFAERIANIAPTSTFTFAGHFNGRVLARCYVEETFIVVRLTIGATDRGNHLRAYNLGAAIFLRMACWKNKCCNENNLLHIGNFWNVVKTKCR